MRGLKNLHQQMDIMLEQVNDMELLLKYKDISNSKTKILNIMYRNTFLNFKQRQRFIACTYAKNSQDAMERLFSTEL